MSSAKVDVLRRITTSRIGLSGVGAQQQTKRSCRRAAANRRREEMIAQLVLTDDDIATLGQQAS
jgi:hypothetical protein